QLSLLLALPPPPTRRSFDPSGLVPVTPDVARRLAVIQREWQRIDPKYLDDDEQRFWATIAGRNIRFDQRAEFARKFTEGHASKLDRKSTRRNSSHEWTSYAA